MRKLLVLLVVLSCVFCAVAEAQQVETVEVATTELASSSTAPATQSKPRFDIGAGYWYTWSKMKCDIYASANDSYGGIFYKKGDKISELDNDLDSGLFIVNADAWIWWRFYADAFVGWSNFDGDHEDSDWLPQYSSALYSFSKSDADGDVVTWNANGYFRLIEEPADKGFLDFSLGYFHYNDDIKHLKNSTLIISDYTVINTPIVGHDSSDEYKFYGIRLGARGKIRLIDRLAIKGAVGICPWADMERRAFWNLREDFGPPPGRKSSTKADSTILDLTVGLEFKITKYIFIEAGYKYMDFDSDNGDEHLTWLSGTEMTSKDAVEVDGHRGGIYGMGRIKF